MVLPFLGPLITFSDLPNAQVAGRTDFPMGRRSSSVKVSVWNGTMRQDFGFCVRQKLVVIDLMPMD